MLRCSVVYGLSFVILCYHLIIPLEGLPIDGGRSSKESMESGEVTLPISPAPRWRPPSTSRPTTTTQASTTTLATEEPKVEEITTTLSSLASTTIEENAEALDKRDAHVFGSMVEENGLHINFKDIHHWRYEDSDSWMEHYSPCGSSNQSPIDINPRSAILKSYPKLVFHNYGKIHRMVLKNTGHTALYCLPDDYADDKTPYITGGGLDGSFKFAQFHLHWGSDSTKGSEHLIKSQRYPGEMHLVHYNTKYESFSDAVEHSDGLAVLAVFIKVGDSDNAFFEPLVNQLHEVQEYDEKTTLEETVSLRDLLPTRTASFYRYSGSLTTPKCAEAVAWTVFDNTVDVSEKQLTKFRSLISDYGTTVVDNFRPTMPMNGRVVTYRSFTGCQISRSWPVTPSLFSEAFKLTRCLVSFAVTSLISPSS